MDILRALLCRTHREQIVQFAEMRTQQTVRPGLCPARGAAWAWPNRSHGLAAALPTHPHPPINHTPNRLPSTTPPLSFHQATCKWLESMGVCCGLSVDTPSLLQSGLLCRAHREQMLQFGEMRKYLYSGVITKSTAHGKSLFESISRLQLHN